MPPYLVVAIIVLALLALIVGWLRTPKRGFPYIRQDMLLSPAERSFYGVLLQVATPRYVVFSKIRLADIVKVRPGLPPAERTTAHNKISGKHVDFVLCDPKTLAIVAVIELDDRSHEAAIRRRRDAFVDGVLSAAKVPILHVPAQRSYAAAEISAFLRELLS